MTKQRVLFYIKDPHGGTGRFIEQLSLIIARKTDWQIRIIAHYQPLGLNIHPKIIGIPIEKQQTFNPLNVFKTAINIISYVNEINTYKPTLIISLDLYANFVCIVAHFFLPNIRFITCTHINLYEHIRAGRKKIWHIFVIWLVRFLYPFSRSHLVPSRELKHQMIDVFGLKNETITVIPNPLDNETVRKKSKEPLDSEDNNVLHKNTFKIFMMARFNEQKNFLTMFKSIAILHKYHVDCTLYILGSGILEQSYRTAIRKLRIANKVVFLGWQSNPFKFLKHADVFTLLTYYECFPYSLLETMSLEIPIISSDIDFGPREILDFGTYGILLSNNNANKLAESLLSLARDTKKRNRLAKLACSRSKIYDSNSLWPQFQSLFISKVS